MGRCERLEPDLRVFLDAAELLAMQLGCGLAARRLAGLDESSRAACVGRVSDRLSLFPRRALVFRPEILYVVARRY